MTACFNMIGWKGAGCEVIEKVPSITKELRYRVIAECGHDFVTEGSKLRAADRQGRTILCTPCAIKRKSARNTAAWLVRRHREPLLIDEQRRLHQENPNKPRKPKNKLWCETCGNMPFRVEGPECIECGLLYEPEKIERAW